MKLLDQLRERIRVKRYSIRMEQAYADWAKCFILSHGERHPKDMGAAEVETFLAYLAVEHRAGVRSITNNQ